MILKKHLWNATIVLEEGAIIHAGTIIYGSGTLILKRKAQIKENCTISLGNSGKIEIGAYTMIHQSVIETTDYSILHWSEDSENKNGTIIIGNHVTITPFSLLIADLGGTIKIGPKCKILGAFMETNGGSINIRQDCLIKQKAVINGAGGVKIMKNCVLEEGVVLFASNHAFSSRKIEMNRQGTTKKGIVLENHIVLKSGVKVLDGVRIKEGSIVESFSTVTKNLDQKGIYEGNPVQFMEELI